MLSPYQTSQMRKPAFAGGAAAGRLVGYTLTPRSFDVPGEAAARLEDKCKHAGFRLSSAEQDVGLSSNPFRNGLWRALRKLMCSRCEPKRMPLSMINFEDFVYQALQPCPCGGNGDDGLVLRKLDDISSDRVRSSNLILALAKRGKHVFAEDSICLSCCHPATKRMLGGAP